MRYRWSEAYAFLHAFGCRPSGNFEDFEDIKDYAFYALRDMDSAVLGEIVDDLGIESLGEISARIQPPEIWPDESSFRCFISHLAKEKDKAARLREALRTFGVKSFVAHEDIQPTLEWQVQIERALHAMDLFISIHTPGFKDSYWSQQEVGFAMARGVKIIAIRMGEDPTGFISKHQALSRGAKNAEQIALEIDDLLSKDDRTKDRYSACKEEHENDDIPF